MLNYIANHCGPNVFDDFKLTPENQIFAMHCSHAISFIIVLYPPICKQFNCYLQTWQKHLLTEARADWQERNMIDIYK